MGVGGADVGAVRDRRKERSEVRHLALLVGVHRVEQHALQQLLGLWPLAILARLEEAVLSALLAGFLAVACARTRDAERVPGSRALPWREDPFLDLCADALEGARHHDAPDRPERPPRRAGEAPEGRSRERTGCLAAALDQLGGEAALLIIRLVGHPAPDDRGPGRRHRVTACDAVALVERAGWRLPLRRIASSGSHFSRSKPMARARPTWRSP